MPHDKNGVLLAQGDRVTLIGTISQITSEQPTFCNIVLLPDIGMADDQPPSGLALSARMVEKSQKDDDITHAGRHVDLTMRWHDELKNLITRIKAGTEALFTGNRAPHASVQPSRERSLALTKLQEAKNWLFEDLHTQDAQQPGVVPPAALGKIDPPPPPGDPFNGNADSGGDSITLTPEQPAFVSTFGHGDRVVAQGKAGRVAHVTFAGPLSQTPGQVIYGIIADDGSGEFTVPGDAVTAYPAAPPFQPAPEAQPVA